LDKVDPVSGVLALDVSFPRLIRGIEIRFKKPDVFIHGRVTAVFEQRIPA
jgi:hypothetical protein